MSESVCVPYGCFENVLKTEESTPLEPGVVENKFFAIGLGVIQEQVTQGGSEILKLTNIKT